MQEALGTLILRQTRAVVLVPGERPRAAALAPRSSGMDLLTDFDRVPVVSVEPRTRIDDALRLMQGVGVPPAIVADAGSNVLGLVTARDILGEKPARYLESLGCTVRACGRSAVTVADIMEPVEHWWVVELRDLAASTTGAVIKTLFRSGRTHIAVVERNGFGSDRLRGLISAADVARRKGAASTGDRRSLTLS
jgi:CBS domain-containing protein